MPVTSKDMLLFLLSSVLVSSEGQRRQRQPRKREDELVEIVAAGALESEEGQFGVEPSVEPLQNRWTLYYEKKSQERAPKRLNERDYLKELTRVRSFQTIRAFWSAWSEVQEECSFSKAEGAANYHMFKDNIRPVWEDSKNVRGGKWVVSLPPSTGEEDTLKSWISLALTLLLGEWGFQSEINGAVLSVRPWGTTLSVWNRNANDRRLVDEVSAKLKELFGVSYVKYQRHQATMRRNHADKARVSRPKRSANSGDDSCSNSDSSEGEERAVRPPRRFSVNDATRGVLREVMERVDAPAAPVQALAAEAETGKAIRHEEVPEVRPRRNSINERRASTSSNEEIEVEQAPAMQLAVKPVPAKRFPLPEVNPLYFCLAAAVLIAGSVLSWSA
jgi:translation initiation factor 4E